MLSRMDAREHDDLIFIISQAILGARYAPPKRRRSAWGEDFDEDLEQARRVAAVIVEGVTTQRLPDLPQATGATAQHAEAPVIEYRVQRPSGPRLWLRLRARCDDAALGLIAALGVARHNRSGSSFGGSGSRCCLGRSRNSQSVTRANETSCIVACDIWFLLDTLQGGAPDLDSTVDAPRGANKWRAPRAY
jgi:hypothetical protein